MQESGESTVRAVLESHFISPTAFDGLLRDPFGAAVLDDFLTERQRTIQDAIEDLLIKERSDRTPQLRELDAETEPIELSIRGLGSSQAGWRSWLFAKPHRAESL